MQFCFIRGAVALVMPVTPGKYQWTNGKNIETIRISQIGDVYRPGGKAPFSGSFDFLLPAQSYPWMESGSAADPQYYLDYLAAWSADDQTVRLVITGTEINCLVYLEATQQGEQDGTGDRYVTVSVREHTDLEAREVTGTTSAYYTGNTKRTTSGSTDTQSYTIVKGDTLSVICRRFYGKSTSTYYNALAKYNGIKNPSLIYAGRTIKIPTAAVLLG